MEKTSRSSTVNFSPFSWTGSGVELWEVLDDDWLEATEGARSLSVVSSDAEKKRYYSIEFFCLVHVFLLHLRVFLEANKSKLLHTKYWVLETS